ncbi:protoheme IX farnesyltransferase, mitochondrial isoform X1 [Procambarus clarkii]|uniref:protoheme IX farnesyltransferase, mitochondrial isoform X1 n=1 Tax=Procambarus clarkii TaxID=6728 RepID=UPI001E673C69|nr:protoheme IX farnesyltransferase, mitochondrial-like isoform X1 [Procambarus clarkii]XP_045601779.1 protoheme IX farnesyltransferase, mitochondrial-like isoform X1 [Procambarus clarkii]
MGSIVWARGLSSLGLASEIACISCTKWPVHVSSKPCLQELRYTHHRRLHKRCKSSVIFLKEGHLQDVDDDHGNKKLLEAIKDVPARSAGGADHGKSVKVLLIEKSSKLKALVSKEAPLLHHAHAGAVVDVRSDSALKGYSTNDHGAVEVHLQVEQLLKDSRTSIQSATNIQPYEDVEYLEETPDRTRERTQLVGALPAEALDWKPQQLDLKKLGSYYAGLSKSRLTGLVVVTAVAGYAMAPAPLNLATLILCSLGTGLTSSAANSVNQFFEVPFDSQMDRTKNRVLVRGLVTPLHAICFAVVCSTAGIGLLYFGANGVAASLGALNLVLYTCVYTPMKRVSSLNTWVGAVVGAIPPLIGWASCTGGLEAGGWIMASILFAWQFPHFNALSWNLRPDYSRAGYRMMSVTNPALCRRVALQYSVAMIGICTLAPVIDVTTWTFAVDSFPLNGYLTYLAWRFYKDADSKSSRKLFLFTLLHLPAVMMLMIISKKHYSKKNNLDTENPDKSMNEKSESIGKISDYVLSYLKK